MNIGIIIVIAIAGIWALGVFFGAIGGLSKTFTQTPTSNIDSESVKSQEEKTIHDTDQKEQQLMADMRQKMQDARRPKF